MTRVPLSSQRISSLPVVDEAYDYGAIAAANSLSDVYAMGGKPFLALNVAAMPDNLPVEITSEILRGGAEKTREAGVVIAGGHTINDKEPKYGLVVVGFVDPNRMLTKSGLRAGDALVLTKPLGFGVTTTALKLEKADEADVREVVGWMSRLNKSASELAVEFDLRGGTDITGYSLLGHGMEMADASGVSLHIEYDKLPLVSCARKYAEMGTFPGGAFDNQGYYQCECSIVQGVGRTRRNAALRPSDQRWTFAGCTAGKIGSIFWHARRGNPATGLGDWRGS